jgi:hypothetical protein
MECAERGEMAVIVPSENKNSVWPPILYGRYKLATGDAEKMMGAWVRALVRYKCVLIAIEKRDVPLNDATELTIHGSAHCAFPSKEDVDAKLLTYGEEPK